MFKRFDVLVAKSEYIEPHETLEDTAGIVLSYNPDSDYLVLGTLHPERYAIGYAMNACGKFYRHATPEEIASFS